MERKYTLRGESLSLPEIIEKYNVQVNCNTIISRLGRGWDIERAITESVRSYSDIHPTAEWKRLSDKPRDHNLKHI